MDCSSLHAAPAPRFVAFARWIAASVMAFVVLLATTHVVLHLPHARARHASRTTHGHASASRLAPRPAAAANPFGALHTQAGAAGAVLLLVTLVLARASGATTFVVGDDRDLLDASDAVIVGEVESVQTATAGDRIERLARVRVRESLEGTLPSRITVRLSGGEIDGRRHLVFGAADLSEGERVVLFLRRRGDGTFTTAQMAMGKFRLVGDGRRALAVRDLGSAAVVSARGGGRVRRRPWDIRELAELKASLGNPGASPAAVPESLASLGHRGAFTMLSSPPARWYEADDGLAILFQTAASPSVAGGLDANWAVQQATGAWSRIDCSIARPSVGGEEEPAPFHACDGRSQILVGDPLDELDSPVRCTGVVGVGGFCSVPGDRAVGGVVYDRITEGDVVINRGFEGCPGWNDVNLSEILTHEVGHTLGLGHSSNDPRESDQRLADAVMYFRAHMDGRGAAVLDDDRDGICIVYPRQAMHDADADGVPDGIDDCPTVADSAQRDHDGDGIGDLCDPLTLGPGMLRPAGGGTEGSHIKIAALLRPATPLDLTRQTLTLSLLAGQAVIHRLVLSPETWSRSNGTAFMALWRDGARRESVRIYAQPDRSYKLRVRGRSVVMARSLVPATTVRIEAGAYVAAGVLPDGIAPQGRRDGRRGS